MAETELKDRPSLNLGDDDLDLSDFHPTEPKKLGEGEKNKVEQVAEQSGFVSRSGRQRRRRVSKSPYKDQIGLKCRVGMKELFQDLGNHLEIYDHTTFERALLLLIEKEGTKEQLKTFQEIVK